MNFRLQWSHYLLLGCLSPPQLCSFWNLWIAEPENIKTWKIYNMTTIITPLPLHATFFYLCIYILFCGYSSSLKMELCLPQLVSDKLLDGFLLIFVNKLLNGLTHALFSQQGQLYLLDIQKEYKDQMPDENKRFHTLNMPVLRWAHLLCCLKVLLDKVLHSQPFDSSRFEQLPIVNTALI